MHGDASLLHHGIAGHVYPGNGILSQAIGGSGVVTYTEGFLCSSYGRFQPAFQGYPVIVRMRRAQRFGRNDAEGPDIAHSYRLTVVERRYPPGVEPCRV